MLKLAFTAQVETRTALPAPNPLTTPELDTVEVIEGIVHESLGDAPVSAITVGLNADIHVAPATSVEDATRRLRSGEIRE